jgi:hypothetical protein
MKTIKAILDCINSRADMYGNRYWAFRYTDTVTGKQVTGMVSGGESNISAIVREMDLDWESVYYTRHELPIREFNRTTKDWAYAGCRPNDELVPFIRKSLG